MNGLKLNQKILVNSSCYFGDEILKLEKTKVADAEMTPRGVIVRMTDEENNWGACPTRKMSDVVATEEDIDKIFNSHVLPMIERKKLAIGAGKGKTLLVIENKNFERGGGKITITYFTHSSTRETLSEGKFEEYISRGFITRTLKVFNDNFPIYVFDSVEGAKDLFTQMVNSYI